MRLFQGQSLGRTDRGRALIAVLAAMLAGAVLLLVEGTATTVVVALVLVALTGMALRSASSAALDAVLMTDLLYASVTVPLAGRCRSCGG